MFNPDFTAKSAISKFDVIRAGKVVATFDSYDEAWSFARQWKTAIVRYYIPKKN